MTSDQGDQLIQAVNNLTGVGEFLGVCLCVLIFFSILSALVRWKGGN